MLQQTSGSRIPVAIIVAAASAVVLALYAGGAFRSAPAAISPDDAARMPLEAGHSGFVSSQTCQSCHPAQYESWHRSYHRTMTQRASAESVRGNFDDVWLEAKGVRLRLTRSDDRFYAQWFRPNGETAPPHQILMVTGSHHYQVYWFTRTRDRRIETLPFVYLFEDERWIPRGSEFLSPPNPHPGRAVWNKGCIVCHSTRPLPRFERGNTTTQVAEFGIACEACHGPGERHVSQMRDPLARFAAYLSDEPSETIVDPEDLDRDRAAAVCAQCHSYFTPRAEFLEDGHVFLPGDSDLEVDRRILNYRKLVDGYAEQYRQHFETVHRSGALPHSEPQPPDEAVWYRDVFWPDGVTRSIGREYTSIEPSGCFQRGDMTCLSCHEMHGRGSPAELASWRDDQLRPGMRGNAACTQCHAEIGDNVSEHSHHASDSPGSDCMSCHMPRNAYGLLSARLNHTVQSPSAASSAEGVGRINGCNICHQRETLGWTAEHLSDWYGHDVPPLSAPEREVSLIALHAAKGDAAQRVLAASLMGWEGQHGARNWQASLLVQLLDDEYDAVRINAYRSLRRLPGLESLRFDYVAEGDARQPELARARALLAALPSVGASETRTARTLYDVDGRLDEGRFAAFAAQRDLTPIMIGE